jgi:hypothetical protein
MMQNMKAIGCRVWVLGLVLLGTAISGGAAAGQLLVEAEAAAQEQAPAEAASDGAALPDATEAAVRGQQRLQRQVRLRLHDGSVIYGVWLQDEVRVETSFGELEIPVHQVQRLRPGLNSLEELRQQLEQLVDQLGSAQTQQRDEAQRELTELGPLARRTVEDLAGSRDAERAARAREVLQRWDRRARAGADRERPPVPQIDQLETAEFTAAGMVQPRAVRLQTDYGELVVPIARVWVLERPSANTRGPQQLTVEVEGRHMSTGRPLELGLQTRVGDRLTLEAEGQMTVRPWNRQSGPEGNRQFGQMDGMNVGTLVIRFDGGPWIEVGDESSLTVEREGLVELAWISNPQNNVSGQGEYEVQVELDPVGDN